MRRLLAAALLATLGMALATPFASAHSSTNQYAGDRHIVAWQNTNNPSPATTANNDSQVWMDEVVAAYASMIDGIKSWDVVMRPVNGGPPSSCHEDLATDPNHSNGYPTEVYINCPWNTTRATDYRLAGPTKYDDAVRPVSNRVWQGQDHGPSFNGKYTIEITVYNAAQSCGLFNCAVPDPSKSEPHCLAQNGYAPCKPGDPTPGWRSLYVINDVSAPKDLSSAFDPTTNRIGVRWTANPEPDASYVVQEKVGDGKWSSGVSLQANWYERPLDQPGKYEYQVKAVRPAPISGNANKTKESAYVAAGTVDVAQLTPPSTAGSGNNGSNGADGAPTPGDPGTPGSTGDSTSPTTAGGGRGGAPAKGGARSTAPIGARPPGTSSPARATAHQPGETEGEGPDEGFSTELPYNTGSGDAKFAEDDGLDEEAGPPTLAGGVVPKPRDTRQLLIFMASALTLFVFAMQLTVLLRKSRPVLAGAAATEQYSDDFDDWLGGF